MRQVFSSPRLENTEAVAQMLREAGIEIRISNGRSYKGWRRGTFRYTDRSPPESAVWVVRAEDQTRARAMLREAGLIDTTRGEAHSYRMPGFHSQADDGGTRKRNGRIKMFLLAAIALVLAMSFLGGLGDDPAPAPAPVATTPPAPSTAPAEATGDATETALSAIARVIFADELATAGVPVVCLGVAGRDASPALIESLPSPQRTLVPASACVVDDQRGNHHRVSGRPAIVMEVDAFEPTGADTATVRFSAYLQPSVGEYKTLEVRRVDGEWRVARTIRHVVLRG